MIRKRVTHPGGCFKPPRYQTTRKTKFYAIRDGHNGFCGVVHSWAHCKVLVNGVSNVAYQAFSTYNEAQHFVQTRPLDTICKEGKSALNPVSTDIVSDHQTFYAIRNGRNGSGVFPAWKDCEAHIVGVPGASCDVFRNYEEAFAFAQDVLQDAPRVTREQEFDPELDESASRHRRFNSAPDERGDPRGVRISPDECEVNSSEMSKRSEDSIDEPEQYEHLAVFTYGLCKSKTHPEGRAGYGAYFGLNSPYNISEPLRSHGRPTRQRAEMTAVLEAIRSVRRNCLIIPGGVLEVRAASQYAKNGDKLVDIWEGRKWKTTRGDTFKYKDMWDSLDWIEAELQKRGVNLRLVWANGQATNPGSKAAKRLAKAGINKP